MIDGIGTVCHEFSHVLGLPDFYDTDYEDNGQSNDPGDWSVMAGGSYMNNNSRTPVGYPLYERWSRLGSVMLLRPLQPKVPVHWKHYTRTRKASCFYYSVEDEFFLMENRQKTDLSGMPICLAAVCWYTA